MCVGLDFGSVLGSGEGTRPPGLKAVLCHLLAM